MSIWRAHDGGLFRGTCGFPVLGFEKSLNCESRQESPVIRKARTMTSAFLKSEASGGIVLMVAALAAMLVANSPWQDFYFHALHAYVGGMSVLHWINDALMAVFLWWDWKSSGR
jgi:hypothetical protein